MKFFRPSASCATLCLLVYLALSPAAGIFAAGAGETERARLEAYSANLLTPYEERTVGERLAFLFEQRHPSINDALSQARLDRIASRFRALVPSLVLEIKIIRGAQPEAVSFPPGRIYITCGLLKLAATDDELAAVIAHEAAHITSRHLARLITLALVLPARERESFPSRTAITTGKATQFVFPAALDQMRLRFETEADKAAVELLGRAGYEGKALAMLLENLNARLSAHDERERASLQTRIALLREGQFLVSR